MRTKHQKKNQPFFKEFINNYAFGILIFSAFSLGSVGCTSGPSCQRDQLDQYIEKVDVKSLETCLMKHSLTGDSWRYVFARILKSENPSDLITFVHDSQIKKWKAEHLNDSTSLVLAIEYNNKNWSQEIISNGFDLDAVLLDAMIPTAYCLFEDSPAVMTALIEGGADPMAVFDSSPLITIASMFNQVEIVKLLLLKGADVNDFDGTNATALMFAAQDGYTEIVKILLENGADPAMMNANDQTALDLAESKSRTIVVEMLKEITH